MEEFYAKVEAVYSAREEAYGALPRPAKHSYR